MNDTTAATRPDSEALFATATEQAGYFTAVQARAAGYSWPLLSYHAKHGRFVRVTRGLYRLRDYPSSPREELIAAWLRLAPDAAISHESALEILDLSDIIPGSIHLTVPRARRRLARQSGVSTHTTTRPLGPADVFTRDSLRMTTAARTIVDVAESGAAPEQVIGATRQAIERGLTTPVRLRAAARSRGRRIRNLIERALLETTP
ncbi:MAG: type IV toxin-antitoxin system AbiEi family antitoxin domain-containing protein [Chloroflexi bacterium]|nr:type IV toxin-antitoxin system AbiEi family antitoxin domain-containing protein [Chloroflexota bacterium]